MASVSVREAKDHFSKMVVRAHHGEEIVIHKRGVPWARLIPLAEPPRGPAGN